MIDKIFINKDKLDNFIWSNKPISNKVFSTFYYKELEEYKTSFGKNNRNSISSIFFKELFKLYLEDKYNYKFEKSNVNKLLKKSIDNKIIKKYDRLKEDNYLFFSNEEYNLNITAFKSDYRKNPVPLDNCILAEITFKKLDNSNNNNLKDIIDELNINKGQDVRYKIKVVGNSIILKHTRDGAIVIIKEFLSYLKGQSTWNSYGLEYKFYNEFEKMIFIANNISLKLK